MNTMGARIYEKRNEKGYTMQELADKLGVQASAVNKWEKGVVQNIKRSTIQKMAEIFGCSPVWLMGLNDDEASLPIKSEASPSDRAIKVAKAYDEAPESIKEAVEKLLDVNF